MCRAREALAYGVAFQVQGLVKPSNVKVGRTLRDHERFSMGFCGSWSRTFLRLRDCLRHCKIFGVWLLPTSCFGTPESS